MTGGLVGANPEQLDDLAVRMNSGADTLEGIRHTIRLSLGRTEWPGPDGDQFRHDWDHHHARVIATAVTALREAARVMRANADQQRAASGADSAGGGSARIGHGPGQGPIAFPPPDIRDLLMPLQNMFYLLDVIENLDDLLVPASRIMTVAEKFLPGSLDVLSVGLSLNEVLAEINRGELSLWSVGNLIWDVASLHPTVGLLTGAAEVGAVVGETLANELDKHLGISQGFIDYVVQDRYGGELTPSESAELVKRYEGVKGYVNIAKDMAGAGWNKVTGFFR